MKRHTVVLALVAVLVLAGCLGAPGTATDPADSPEISPEAVPGVTNGTLSNASALADANREAVRTEGAIVQINQSAEEMDIDARLVVGANVSAYSLSAAGTIRGDESTTIDQWSNESTRFVRTTSATETNYRVLEGHDGRLSILSQMAGFLSAGNFAVANETAGDGLVVLTATNASTTSTSMATPERFDGRLVVAESGQIQELSVTLTRDGEQVSYTYELRQAGVQSVPEPDWLDDVPPGATVQAELSVDVANDSYLTLEHIRGDVVPSGTTIRVESNGTTDTATLGTSLSAGNTRYVYFDAGSQDLRVATERPGPHKVSPVTSPVSVRIVTEGGAVLHSGSMGWASETAGEGSSSSASGSMTTESAHAIAAASP